MSVPQEEPEGLYVEHQYMCSECHQLFNTLEDVLVHQQSHAGMEAEEGEDGAAQLRQGEVDGGESQYQCLECGALLRNPDELLLHQELHMREAGLEPEHELCEVVEAGGTETEAPVSTPIQYQCLECLALFDTPELWLAHRQSHSRSSTHSDLSNTEYILQPDGSITPLVNVQNLVLDEQRAGEILSLAQVLAQQQLDTPATTPRASFLPPASPMAGSATLRLQICTAQALADGSTTSHRTKLLPLLTPLEGMGAGRLGGTVSLENGLHRLDVSQLAGKQEQLVKEGEVVIIHPYECSECALLFQTPEDFLQHQGEHFLGQDKESGEEGVMEGYVDEERRRDIEVREPEECGRVQERARFVVGPRPHSARSLGVDSEPVTLQCGECQRIFTSANRLAAHRRVHEHGTHECPECDKVFKKPGSLQTHMRSHSGEARYLCVDCGHGFSTEMTLIIHRKSHTAEPLHRCQFCAKTFTNMTKFLYHRRTHTARANITSISMTPLAPRRQPAAPLSILQRARERKEASKKEGQNEAIAVESGLLASLTGDKMDTYVSAETEHSAAESVASAAASQQEGATGAENGLDSIFAPQSGEELQNGGEMPSDPHTLAVTAGTEAVTMTGNLERAEADSVTSCSGLQFPCPSCTKVFPTQLRLVRHRRTVHVAERRFKCSICSKPFKKQIHVRNHLRTHTGERPFQCSDCGKTFSSLANLSRHSLTHSGLRPYRCDICHKAFSQSSNLRQHRLLHSNTPPCPCPDCPATFLRPAKLAAHRFTQHPGSPAPYPCPHCPQGFLRKRKRDLHCLEEHPTISMHASQDATPQPALIGEDGKAVHVPGLVANESQEKLLCGAQRESGAVTAPSRPSLDCSICGKRLNSAANFRLHQLSHGMEICRPRSSGLLASKGKAHQCPVCGKLFVSSSSVALHQRVHTGERPFPCTVCGKRFRQNTHLREHLRTHSGERPFCCEICGKGFVQSMHLAEHRRTHTGERPHPCPDCGKAFKTISNLRNHQKIHARAQQQQQEKQQLEQLEEDETMETSTAVAVVDASGFDLTSAVPALCQQGALGQPQLIQIQTSDLPQSQGTPTIMCNEFGETIAIIETSEGGTLPLAEALEIYQTALENTLGVPMDSITVDGLQLL
ncbi:zinc finger protein 574 isoform X2 [Denticeps clupeoides]|uniref:C2H2-type domain-containing protein n=1 Tax=Denticeps clupeoides TaxID=299321 RepID=A0AAY4AFV1_9TELE|nr:zinc finger protein 574 isoform X2 [Denticeps clupeoides]